MPTLDELQAAWETAHAAADTATAEVVAQSQAAFDALEDVRSHMAANDEPPAEFIRKAAWQIAFQEAGRVFSRAQDREICFEQWSAAVMARTATGKTESELNLERIAGEVAESWQADPISQAILSELAAWRELKNFEE